MSAPPRGPLLVELTRLMQVTGGPKYYSAVAGVAALFSAGHVADDG